MTEESSSHGSSVHPDPFEFEFRPGLINFGRGALSTLDSVLADSGCERGLVVCGENVSANTALMEQVHDGLADRHVGTFTGTTPEKRLSEAVAAARRADELGADVLVPVGGGSSLDVATVASAIRADDRGLDAVRNEVRETGGISLPGDRRNLTPLVPIPTTFAGADLSVVAGITVDLGEELVSTGVGGEELMPAALVYDPAAFETTPASVLAGSAMNGFDKGLEAIYARDATPITDATAVRGLRLLRSALPSLFEGNGGKSQTGSETVARAAMGRAVAGVILVQFGVSTPDRLKLNVIHAFGHGCRDAFGIQQGLAHAVLAPHVLRAILSRCDARRSVLAEGLGVDLASVDDVADRIVGEVERVRDGLGVPTRLRDLDGTSRDALTEAVEITVQDGLMAFAPPGLELSSADIHDVFEAAW